MSTEFDVYCVTHAPDADDDDKGFWTRIGRAFPHKKGDGYNILLNALPTNGKMVLLPPKEDDTEEKQAPKKQYKKNKRNNDDENVPF
jgi:hypothetical protein